MRLLPFPRKEIMINFCFEFVWFRAAEFTLCEICEGPANRSKSDAARRCSLKQVSSFLLRWFHVLQPNQWKWLLALALCFLCNNITARQGGVCIRVRTAQCKPIGVLPHPWRHTVPKKPVENGEALAVPSPHLYRSIYFWEPAETMDLHFLHPYIP